MTNESDALVHCDGIDGPGPSCSQRIAALEAEIAGMNEMRGELMRAAERDARRLDWLDGPTGSIQRVTYLIRRAQGKIQTFRAALDAAMDEWPGKPL